MSDDSNVRQETLSLLKGKIFHVLCLVICDEEPRIAVEVAKYGAC